MSTTLILSILITYFLVLVIISYFTSRNASDSDSFFLGSKSSPWYLVAFGMIGTSISGVTFISVPGKVGVASFSYFQLVFGYFAGYMVVAGVLLPLYYKLNVTSIYSYLETRFGFWSYKTGSSLFILSRTIGSALRLFLAADVLQLFLFERMGVPFQVTVAITIVLIWLYTFKGGVKTIVWTDSFQTLFLVAAVVISVFAIGNELNWKWYELFANVNNSSYSRIFFFEDPLATNYFWKQFVSGMFITIVMTGLDQDLMQKNLSCKNIGEAKKNMYWFSFILVGVNFLFLSVGALLFIYAQQKGIAIPAVSDQFYPSLALNHLGLAVGVFFLLGIIASSYASSDSALTALTTSFCIDFLDFANKDEKLKQKQRLWVHVGFSVLFFLIIVIFKYINQKAIIDVVLGAASFTYGPLLGMFAYGIFTHKKVKDVYVPIVVLVAPILTYVLYIHSQEWLWGYQFAFEHLLINGLLTMLGLYLIQEKK